MKKYFVRVRQFIKGFGHVWYHIGLVSLSAGIAMSLPNLGQALLSYWDLAKNQKFFLVSAEIMVAIVLIVFFNHLRQSLAYKKLAKVANGAGLVNFFPVGGRLAQKKITHLLQEQGLPRRVMIIGSTGQTFVDPQGDSYAVLRNCLEAKIMLLNPCSDNAKIRATSILHPEVTLDTLKTQARMTVDFLKLLKAAKKNVTLKLYSEDPNVKLAILGDHVWIQHYHTTLDVQSMPMYVFKHNPKDHGLYTIFYQHFVSKWDNPETPEYDLETDELVYRWPNGAERRREHFSWDGELVSHNSHLLVPEASPVSHEPSPALVAMDSLQATG
ncbi:MAG: hypothetical protein VST68_04675 [Nitrospirota bacterium]|nr:hypothetical protein [Nitrospirota bacterium]